jgi:hypothetical protein
MPEDVALRAESVIIDIRKNVLVDCSQAIDGERRGSFQLSQITHREPT